jgi:hypothetical protein
MNLEDTKPEDLEESPAPDAAESKKDKNEEDDYLAEKKAKESQMLSKIESFLDANQIDPEQITTADLQCLVLAFSVRDEAEKIYQSESFKEILAGACEDFPNYNNDIEDLSGVMDVTLAEARDEFASSYEHPEWLMIAGKLASMLHGGLT